MKKYEPMLCQKSEPFSSDKYLFEPKLDGARCIAHLEKGICVLKSRSGGDLTLQFPEIAYNFHPGAVLDGEIVVLNENGVPSFNHLQHRLHRTNALQIRHAQRIYPAVYFVFDVLWEDSRGELIKTPLLERKAVLQDSKLAELSLARDSSVRLVPYVIGEGEALFDKLVERGWEGVVAKPLDSMYISGNRKYWKKSKATNEGVFIICGVTKGTGNRDGAVGALVLGEVVDNELVYAGEAGTGLTFDDVRGLPHFLAKRDECPFNREPSVDNLWYWVTPRVHVEVEYFERSPGGRLRFPSVKRIRVRGRVK